MNSHYVDNGGFVLKTRATYVWRTSMPPLVAAVDAYTKWQRPCVLTMSIKKFEQFEYEWGQWLSRCGVLTTYHADGILIHGWVVRPLEWDGAVYES